MRDKPASDPAHQTNKEFSEIPQPYRQLPLGIVARLQFPTAVTASSGDFLRFTFLA